MSSEIRLGQTHRTFCIPQMRASRPRKIQYFSNEIPWRSGTRDMMQQLRFLAILSRFIYRDSTKEFQLQPRASIFRFNVVREEKNRGERTRAMRQCMNTMNICLFYLEFLAKLSEKKLWWRLVRSTWCAWNFCTLSSSTITKWFWFFITALQLTSFHRMQVEWE